MHKITIVGAGRVGESTAANLAKGELARELVLIDVREGVPQGTALDIQECAPIFGFDTKLTGHTTLEAMEGSDLVIITAGFPRKPGQSRSDVLDANVPIIESIVDSVRRVAPQSMILQVSNPVDVLTYVAWRRSGFARERVLGLSGVLDATRMASFIALETGLSVQDIRAMVLGGHGDAMLPLPRYSCVNGVPLSQFLDGARIAALVERTRQGGAEILALRKTASAYDAPAAAIATMVDAISHARRRVLPCVAVLDGEYGLRDICMGVPVVLGERGVERVIELELAPDEAELFQRSAAQVRADLARRRR